MKADQRAVIDTPVLISAALLPDSLPALVVQQVLNAGRLVFCDETFAELETRLWRPKFDRYLTLEARKLLLHDFVAAADWVALQAGTVAWSRDATDDKFIALALAGPVDLLISGDQDLLMLHQVGAVRIKNPAQTWPIVAAWVSA